MQQCWGSYFQPPLHAAALLGDGILIPPLSPRAAARPCPLLPCTQIDLAGPSNAALALVLALVACVGACDGVAQGALFGEAALLPPGFTQALVAGTSVSGVAVSLLRIATKATLPDTPSGLRTSGQVYFALAAATTGAATVIYLLLPRLAVVRWHRQASLEAALAAGERVSRLEDQPRRNGAETASPAGKQQQQQREASLDLELSSEDHLRSDQADREQQEQQYAGSDRSELSVHQELLPHQRRLASSNAGSWQAGHPLPATGELASGAGGSSHSEGWQRGRADVSYLAVLRHIWKLASACMGIYV